MPLSYGVVALVDILGFKNVWQRTDPDRLLDRMRRIAIDFEAERKEYTKSFESTHRAKLAMRAAFLSDTIAIGVGSDERGKPESMRYAFSTLSSMVLRVVEAWAVGEPPMALRGCVCAGSFAIRESFLIGEAVDEAAQHFERADGAFVWLTPSAMRECFENGNHSVSFGFLKWQMWDVPLKSATYRTLCLDSSRGRAVKGRPAPDLSEPILRSFGDGSALDVTIKRQNTERFFEACKDP